MVELIFPVAAVWAVIMAATMAASIFPPITVDELNKVPITVAVKDAATKDFGDEAACKNII